MKGGLAGNVEDNLDCQHERLAAEAKARHEAVLLAARIEGAKAMQAVCEARLVKAMSERYEKIGGSIVDNSIGKVMLATEIRDALNAGDAAQKRLLFVEAELERLADAKALADRWKDFCQAKDAEIAKLRAENAKDIHEGVQEAAKPAESKPKPLLTAGDQEAIEYQTKYGAKTLVISICRAIIDLQRKVGE